MKSKDFLRSKGILSNDSDHYIIDFHDGREINLGDLLEEYAQQSQPSGMRWVKASERLPDIDTSDKWNNDNKITKDVVCWSKEWGRRFGRYYYNSGRWSIDGVLSSNQIVIEYWVDLTNPSESSPAGAAEHYIYDKEKDDFVRDEDGERVCLSSQKEVYDYLKAEGLKEDWIATNFVSLLPFAPSDFLKCKKLNHEIKS